MTTIAAASIGTAPSVAISSMTEPKVVTATFKDGRVEELFEFYSDELSFTPGEFVGLTADEARALHRERDIAYLRS